MVNGSYRACFQSKGKRGDASFVSFDADKDGKDEFIGLEVDGKNGKYAGFFDKLASGTNFETTDFTLSLPQQPKRLFVGDYNNDGLADLLVLYQDGYTVFYNQGGRNLRTLLMTTISIVRIPSRKMAYRTR